MSLVREFLATRIKMNCAWYSIPMSVLFTWRYTHLRQIPFSGPTAAKMYFIFLAVTYILFMVVFFVLFAIARKKALDNRNKS
jgi:hypothetical protein